ncbi:putative fungal zinc cluster transcription factor [Pseudozyma hubeiensis]|nr:putative fungal zinc cluster transcription factor [Pseudozyma hubeiensis]
MQFLARRAFSSRSAIRAPPAPSSTVMASAVRSTVRPGRVAMLPKAAEPTSPPASAGVSTAATSSPDVFPQVGSISVPGEQPNVIRTGEH